MVRALAYHQCVPDPIPGPGVICGFLRNNEQGWRSSGSARLPPMCPGFDSRTVRHMWIEIVVGSRPCFEGFSPGSLVFLPPQKPTFLNSNSIGNSRAMGLSVEDCYVSPSLNKFVVGSRPFSEGFSPGSPVFFPPQKPTFLNSNSIGNSRAMGLSVEDCYVSPSLNKVDLLIFLS